MASFDLLYNLRTYTDDSHNIALYCGPLLVLSEAKLVMATLLAALDCRENLREDHNGRPLLDTRFVLALLFYFCIVYQVALLVCINKALLLTSTSLVPCAPWPWNDGASYISTCEQHLDDYIKRSIYPDQTSWSY
jgi:hypothetical protein